MFRYLVEPRGLYTQVCSLSVDQISPTTKTHNTKHVPIVGTPAPGAAPVPSSKHLAQPRARAATHTTTTTTKMHNGKRSSNIQTSHELFSSTCDDTDEPVDLNPCLNPEILW